MANEYYLQHCIFSISTQEGGIKRGDSGYMKNYNLMESGNPVGIGIMQWSNSRSFDLIRDIYVALGNDWGGITPPDSIKNAVESNSQWGQKTFNGSEQNWWYKFGNLAQSKSTQESKAVSEVQGYLNQINGQGITDMRAAGYTADIAHHYGTGYVSKYGSDYNGLDLIFNATVNNGFRTRHVEVYEYFKNANFDTPPPVTFDGEGIYSDGGDYEETLGDDGEVFGDFVSGLLGSYAYHSGSEYQNSWMRLIPIQNTYKPKLTLTFARIDWSKFGEYIADLLKKLQDQIDSGAKDDIENAPPDAIQRVIDKANSYADTSVPYGWTYRDMVRDGDCSSFVAICFKAGGVDLGGAAPHTGIIYKTCKDLGKVVVEGRRSEIPQILSNARAGDIIMIARNDSTFGSGDGSHTGLMISSTTMRHAGTSKNRMVPYNDELDYYLNSWVTSYQNFALLRPIG